MQRVEDVLSLGDEVTVRVDDVDPAGKLSLSLVGDESPDGGDSGSAPTNAGRTGAARRDSGSRSAERTDERPSGNGAEGNGRDAASFEDVWADEARAEFGDLGPDEARHQPAAEAGARRRGPGGGPGGGRRRGRR